MRVERISNREATRRIIDKYFENTSAPVIDGLEEGDLLKAMDDLGFQITAFAGWTPESNAVIDPEFYNERE